MRRTNILLVGLLYCQLCCSNEAPKTVVGDKENPVQPAAISNEAPSPRSKVEPIGYFTNVESNGEHQWGYTIELWKQDDQIFGLLSGNKSGRTIGDPPTGVLDGLVYDENTNKLSFSSKLPSFNYSFEGILSEDRITGTLKNTTWNETDKIDLRLNTNLTGEMMDEYSTYENWRVFADRILKLRGPKS